MNERRVIEERSTDGGASTAAVSARAESLVRELLALLGEDPDREGLLRTPERVARAYRFLTEGYRKDVDELFNEAYFDEEYDEMVLVKDIEFYSLCEHHLLPFFGKVHVAYLPRRKIVGLSNLPALVGADASALYARNLLNFMGLLIDSKSGEVKVNRDDEIIAGCLVCIGGEVVKRG